MKLGKKHKILVFKINYTKDLGSKFVGSWHYAGQRKQCKNLGMGQYAFFKEIHIATRVPTE